MLQTNAGLLQVLGMYGLNGPPQTRQGSIQVLLAGIEHFLDLGEPLVLQQKRSPDSLLWPAALEGDEMRDLLENFLVQ